MARVTIDLRAGAMKRYNVTKDDVQKNIDALDRAIGGKLRVSDTVLLLDTRSILAGIQKELPVGEVDENGVFSMSA